ncbi:hypothetical protein OQY15_15835 [Pedobacter sp. MC2016-15]|uniref:hypothetical protein n=1 Tax=Pedobacter sp. MC2016-15 TaxID=2994473 RepID=UPI002245A49A|nr:hypothetical protein [Pedobacter sp. MC2016-15]MCX2480575.1 hypothetical protein [Pedobacter sp. MC2016-15]
MIKTNSVLKPLFCSFLILFLSAGVLHAQEKTKVIGNKARNGSSNSTISVIKGNQLGIKMSAGSKPVELINLSFGVDNRSKESLKFKVNVYEFNGILSGENYVKKDIIGAIPTGKNRVSVDLEPFHIEVKKDLLVTIEWLETLSGPNPGFAIGVFNGGSYEFKEGKWKRVPVFGYDFNMLVKKLKK